MNDKVKAFFKEKGFYISLLVGVIAILAVGIISANMLTGEDVGDQQLAENEPEASLVEVPQPEISLAENDVIVKEPAADSAEFLTENVETVKNEPKETEAAQEEKVKTADAEKVAEAEPEVAPVISQSDKMANLKFDQEKGLLWPITGEVLMPFSMEKAIPFKTLAQYKVNPAMLIAGTEDMEVLSAYDGVITKISENEEIGTTVTMSIGDGFELVYGNLKDVTWAEGDFVAEGAHLGSLAAPTKYYVEEGTNLYFQVVDNGEKVDPLLVLR